MRKLLGLMIGTAAVLGIFAPTWAGEYDQMREEMRLLKQKLQQQEKLIKKLEQNQNKELSIETIQRDQLKDMMQEILADSKAQPAMPKWMKNLKFFGDLRLRYQFDHKDYEETGDRRNRNRARYRIRFGIKKTWWNKQLEVGFRLASGSGPGPDSTNQTFDGSFSKKMVWIDLAYARYAPEWAKGLVITGGKMKNPIRTKTLMSWDGDINPEGVHLSYEAPFFGDFKPYTAGGFFILDEESKGQDTLLWTYELGFTWKIQKDLKWFLGGTYYNYRHWQANAELSDDYADFEGKQIFELTTKVTWKMFDMPFQGWFSWMHNCDDAFAPGASDEDKYLASQNNAYAIGIKVGKNKAAGDWSAQYIYAYEEANALAQVNKDYGLSDSDFGGPNRKGHIIRGAYSYDKNLTIGANLYFTQPIESASEENKFTMQLDLKWKF